jgi:hypothetical protein
MAEITTTQSFSDGDTVTATKLNNIQANASVQPEAITNRTAETSIDQANDLLLIYDASATALKKVSPSNLIKAGTASDFPVTGNATIGGTLGVTGNSTLSGTLGVTGAITATSTINGTTIPATKTLVTTVDTQTLTNKTLTTPVISSISNTGTLTLPTDTDTLVGRATTDTLTNKTLTSPSISTPTITGQITASTSIINVGSGQIYKDASGNVGVGTTSPTANLHVVKTTSQTDIDSATQAVSITNTASDTSGNLTGIRLRQDNATNVAQGYIGLSSTGNLATRANLIIATPNTSGNSTERLRIDSSGNVGIGQSSLTSTLTVNKAGTDTVIQMQEGGTNTAQIESFQSSLYLNVAGANNIIFRPNSSEMMRIDSSGNVGIGTASPQTNLHIGSTSNANHEALVRLNSGGATGQRAGLQFFYENGATPSARISVNASQGALEFDTANTERLRIASAGQIGIGGANYGSSGQVLTSGGASAAPSWTTISTTPADGSITAPKLSGAQTGSAPIYGARAWVNFNGVLTTGQIRASGNVSTITDVTASQFLINFTTAMPDANYSVAACSGGNVSLADASVAIAHIRHYAAASGTALLVGSVAIHTGYGDSTNRDDVYTTVTIFR